MKQTLFSIVVIACMAFAGCSSDDEAIEQEVFPEELTGHWVLEGWSEYGSWHDVDMNYNMSFDINASEQAWAYSINCTIYLGTLSSKGSELHFNGRRIENRYALTPIKDAEYFESKITHVDTYQIEGNKLHLYYNNDCYLQFVLNNNVRDEIFKAMKGTEGSYFGRVLDYSESLHMASVRILSFPSLTQFYVTMPPLYDAFCYLDTSNMPEASFAVGDIAVFQIDSYQRLGNTERTDVFYCKALPFTEYEQVEDGHGVMRYIAPIGWYIEYAPDPQTVPYKYYLMQMPSDESFLEEGLEVSFSGRIYNAWYIPNPDILTHPASDRDYFVNLDKISKREASSTKH